MKRIFLTTGLFGLLGFTVATAQQAIWVSDEIQAPLRESPELNARIITLLPAGQRVNVLEETEDYVKIETQTGEQGWLSTYYVLRERSVHEKFQEIDAQLQAAQSQVSSLTTELEEKNNQITQLQAEIENTKSSADTAAQQAKNSQTNIAKLQEENELLQEKLAEQTENVAQLSSALDAAKQQATDERARYLGLAKVSENAVEIDEQNRQLQEQAVKFEKEIQLLRTENQTLNANKNNKERIIGALTLLGGIIVGYIFTFFIPGRRRKMNRY